MALPSLYKSIQAPGGTNPQDVQIARDEVAMQYAPQESAINASIDQINQYLARDVSAQQNFGQIADQKIAQVGNEVVNKLQGNVGAISDIYNKGTASVGSAYDDALATLGKIGQSVQAPIQQGMENLGIKQDQYGRDPLSRLQGDLAVYQSRTAAGKGIATGRMGELGTALTGIAQKKVGDTTAEYGQRRADLANDVLNSISGLRLKANEGVMGELRKYGTLAETLGPAFRSALNQAANARTSAERENAKNAIEAMKAQASIQKDLAGNDPNSLDNLLKMAELQNKGLTGQKLQRELERPTFISDAEGQRRLQEFLSGAVRRDATGAPATEAARAFPGLSGTSVAGIQNFFNQNSNMSRMSGLYNTSDPVAILTAIAQSSIDPKTGKVNLPVTSGSKYKQQDYQIDLQTLLDAIGLRYTNVGTGARVGDLI